MTDLNKYYEISELIAAYVADEEKVMPAKLASWLEESEANAAILDGMLKEQQLRRILKRYDSIGAESAWDEISKELFPEKVVLRKTLWTRVAVAAAAVITIFLSVWIFSSRQIVVKQETGQANHDAVPGKNTAVLTLANGKAIVLSDAKTGVIVDASKLTYNDGSKVQGGQSVPSPVRDPSLYSKEMELSTPRGGTYQVILPDGTKVWLNAASSLKFPETFHGLFYRKVFLSGEAYFEVSKNKKLPFVVVTDQQEVKVLGTHFNINSYADEQDTKTTLLEGSVQVSRITSRNDVHGSEPVILKPNQQSSLTAGSGKLKVTDADIEEVTSWKNGYFKFNNEPIESIMRKISRWYNVEVSYQGKVSDDKFGGTISRYQNVSQVLEMLELTQLVKFKVQGRRITVM